MLQNGFSHKVDFLRREVTKSSCGNVFGQFTNPHDRHLSAVEALPNGLDTLVASVTRTLTGSSTPAARKLRFSPTIAALAFSVSLSQCLSRDDSGIFCFLLF